MTKSKDVYNATFNKIFARLTEWRNLPKYQLERRADIFFSLYLKEIIEAELGNGTVLQEEIIPEFPIKIACLNSNDTQPRSKDENHTVNVDYVMFSEKLETIYLIEFKTDPGSSRDVQNRYLKNTFNKINTDGFDALLKGLLQVFEATAAKQKYYHLLSKLADFGLLAIPQDVGMFLYADRKQGLTHAIKNITTTPLSSNLRKAMVVYILPETFDDVQKADLPEGTLFITFSNVVKTLKGHNDPFARELAIYIDAWDSGNDRLKRAGARGPQFINDELKALV